MTKKADPDSTMSVTPSMILPLDNSATMALTPDMIVEQTDATMMLTPDMVVNDLSIVMGREQIERSLSTVSLWHAALARRDLETMLATLDADVELLGPRGATRGHAAFRDWFTQSGFSAVAKRRYCGGLGIVVVEQQAKWRYRDGEDARTIGSAFVVRAGKIVKYERFDELAQALTCYGLRDAHEIVRRP